jgi:uncharacterized protein (TIGR02599 family)
MKLGPSMFHRPHTPARTARRTPAAAFTLIELLVSVTFLVVLMLVVTQVIGIVQRTWVRANSRVSQFREARRAFDVISRNLSQATLNTYWSNDLQQISADGLGQAIKSASKYQRKSELEFICGPTAQVLTAASGSNYPGHAVFFQAPLGVVRLTAATGNQVNTENMTNLLCGRGYFVEWGNDTSFRPAFLSSSPFTETVPSRWRLRLMEYSPTSEMNRIYDSSYRTNPTALRQWYQNSDSGALAKEVTDSSETAGTRYFTRPIAENILALIIAPQKENLNNNGSTSSDVYAIAPNYFYDSAVTGPTASASNVQGTQHLMPPLLKITMIALDERSAEVLSTASNSAIKDKVLSGLSSLFLSASTYTADLEGTPDSPGALKALLLTAKLNYRVFTTTIALKQARWSF